MGVSSRTVLLYLGILNFVLVAIGSIAVLTIVFTGVANADDIVWMWSFTLFTFASSGGTIAASRSGGRATLRGLQFVLFVGIALNVAAWILRLTLMIVPCLSLPDFQVEPCNEHMWLHILTEILTTAIVIVDVAGIVAAHYSRKSKVRKGAGSVDTPYEELTQSQVIGTGSRPKRRSNGGRV